MHNNPLDLLLLTAILYNINISFTFLVFSQTLLIRTKKLSEMGKCIRFEFMENIYRKLLKQEENEDDEEYETKEEKIAMYSLLMYCIHVKCCYYLLALGLLRHFFNNIHLLITYYFLF